MNPSSFIDTYVLPTGRRLHAQGGVRERAEAMSLMRIVAHADQAIAHDRQTQRMELALAADTTSPNALFTPRTLAVDRRADKTISGFDGYLASQSQIHDEDTPVGQAARAVRAQIFPRGARAITSLPYVQQYETVEGMLSRLAEPDMQAHVAILGDAPAIIAQLAAVNAEYGASLDKPVVGPGREAVRAANARGQDFLAETIALIIAEFAGTQGDPRFAALMEPIIKENEAMRGRYRRRRGNGAGESEDTTDDLPEADDADYNE